MRALVPLVLAVFLLPGAAALALPAADPPAPPQGAGDDRAPRGPHVLAEIANRGSEQDVRVSLHDARTGREVAARSLTLRAGVTTMLALDGPREPLVARVEALAAPAALLGGGGGSQAADLEDCPGPYHVGFFVDEAGAVGVGLPPSRGCLAVPEGLVALAAEAAEAARLPERPGRAVAIPLPGAGDAGEILVWAGLGAPAWEAAARARFAWSARETFPDAWGRPVPGHVATHGFIRGGSETRASPALGPPASLDASLVPLELRYRDGDPAPVARAVAEELHARASRTDGRVHAVVTLAHEAPARDHECMIRHALQGVRVHEGARFPASALCVAAAPPGAVWRAGGLAERRGFRALPLYLLHEGADGGRVVARVWLADGVPYPLDAEAYAAGGDAGATHFAARLDRLRAGGAPLPADGPAPRPPPPVPLAPLNPLEGPALGPDARRRFPLPLDEAARAAASDPTLPGLANLLGRPSPALAGAALRVLDGDPPTHAWALVFVARGATPVLVVCERTDPGAPVALPPRCREAPEAPSWASALATPPPMDATAIPALAASFDVALARWRATDAAASDASFGLYRAWGASVVGVGAHFPVKGALPVEPAPGDVSLVLLDLATGRTRAESRGVLRLTGITDLPAAVLVAGGTPPPGSAPPPLPLMVGLGAAGLVGLAAALALAKGSIAALFTRLVRSKVLDHETRARIREVVRAEPGIHASGVAERLGVAHGVADHHLGVLVREGLLSVVETPGFRRFFLAGSHSRSEVGAIVALGAGQSGKLYGLIEANPGIPLTALAREAGVSLPHASKTVKRLVEAGLVERVRCGRNVNLYAAPPRE